MNGLRARSATIIVGFVLAVSAGCGADSDSDEPLGEGATTFILRDVSGLDYPGLHEPSLEGPGATATQLVITNVEFPDGMLWTPCGSIGLRGLEITDERLVTTQQPSGRLDRDTCTAEQRVAAEVMAAVLASDPTYQYDGERLRVSGDGTTLTFDVLGVSEPGDLTVGGSAAP